MISVKADLHIHTFLSPCGDIEMTPLNIIRQAKAKDLQLIAITDHNSTLQGPEIRRVGLREGLAVLYGAEITTREEVHCLAYVGSEEQREELQQYLEKHLPHIPNDPDIFGYQFWVDEKEQILGEAPYLLISAIDQSIDQVAAFVHSIGGLFVPAHIERPRNSLLSQLGFVPPGLPADALELSRHADPVSFRSKNNYLKKYKIIQSSDAHHLCDVGSVYTTFEMDVPGFDGLKKALTTSYE
ncbi:MAG TPA: PHP domain-containing protein [Bacteroidales bacterium]|nr:MAG: DNA polymerase III PolC-type [Bacteroidetes bacterium ADurb.Bin037]HPV88216.1 PHP domain-containing protein [Bacteroidales bacterium]HPW77751.1 PHP domain-containing protein [Bacteroidales bacterium]HQB55442.1 PHP domain-containing protein [Bacteroidales bacterium]